MGIVNRLFRRSTNQVSQSGQGGAIAPNPKQPKTLAELEREIDALAVPVHIHHTPSRRSGGSRWLNRLIGLGLLVGIPVGALWVINLPYPPIRRPIARTAPMLLLPSYMSVDRNYRDALELVEQADQLIDDATSASDLALGGQKLEQAQASLDNLPIWFLYDYPEYRSWWYSWRFSPVRFDEARRLVGTLEAKLFQENNAQTALNDAEAAVQLAQAQYEAATPENKAAAIAPWQAALDLFQQIPPDTLAGQTAQQSWLRHQRNFEAIVGSAANAAESGVIIEAARNFAWEAAKLADNPPHSVAEWQQIAQLWELAIARLSMISPDDVAAYREAQQTMAQYESNLAQVRIRLQTEDAAARTLAQVQNKIQDLQSISQQPGIDRGYVISELQNIIDQLRTVSTGTTAYAEAQQLLILAQNRLNELTPNPSTDN